MIDQATLTTYLLVLVGFVLIPGPAVLLTLARASTSGTRVGIATGLGIAVGDIVHTLLAVLTEVLNPKSALFFLAFLPQFVVPANGHVASQLLTLGVLFVSAGFLVTLFVAFAAGRVGAFLGRNPVVVRWQGKVVGSVYCALGVRLALQER